MIHAKDLAKSYGDLHAVDGVSFDIAQGEIVGLLGPNGAGKSTTMKILTGFLHADRGEVLVDGVRVDPEDPGSKGAVGYLPETTPLYPRMRATEYLDFIGRMHGLGGAARRDALERVVADADLAGYADRRIGTLSKGYRQRVGLAQALFADPKVLVLDEPTSGLDPAEIGRIRELIARLGRTKTILLSTHVLAEVQETCRRVLILAGGRLVADGSPLDLAESEAVELCVTFDAAGPATPDELAAIDGVESVRRLGEDPTGRRAYALAVADRWAVAERVFGAAHAEGWRLVELRHDLPSLERVFLSRTGAVTAESPSPEARALGPGGELQCPEGFREEAE